MMRPFPYLFLLMLLSTAMIPTDSFCQTVIPGGSVSGTWDLSGSPYLIEGEITIPAGDTLTIAPACSVIFQGHYKLIVNGTLEAIGTEADSIVFTAANPDSGWHSIRFLNAPAGSQLSYCIVVHGRATGTYPNNRGGGIYCSGSNPVITHSTIRENTATSGAGIACDNNSDAEISYCAISANSALSSDGGGIHCWNGSDPGISYCVISGNSTAFYGGGAFIGSSSTPVLNRCTISGNSAGASGGGINVYLSNPIIRNSIVEGNAGSGGVNLYGSGGTSVTYSDFYNNSGGNFTGNSIPAGLGVINALNSNGDPCDVFKNVFLNPLFSDPSSGNFQITWANFPTWDETRSPCIDAGNPDPLGFDPDNTTADMGAFYFDQSAFPPLPDIGLSASLLDFGTVIIGSQAALPLTIHNLGNSTLVLYAVFVSGPSFSTDFDPADSLIYPTDSLVVTVYFSPLDTVAYEEILTIENNDEPSTVVLQGIGLLPPEPAISTSADTLDFDSVMVGYHVDLPLVIYNTGDTTLVLYGIAATDPAFTSDFDPADSLIAPGDSLSLTVTFSPTGWGLTMIR